MALINVKVKPEQKERLESMRVHDRQGLHEIVQFLLDTHDKYVHIMDNDMDDGR
jgi:hypothetical protein